MTFEKTCESLATRCIFSDAAGRWALVLCEMMSDISCVVCCEIEKPGVRSQHAFSQCFSIRCEDTSVCHTPENISLKWTFYNTNLFQICEKYLLHLIVEVCLQFVQKYIYKHTRGG